MSLESLIEKKRVLVLLGAGGVGKTSCSLGVAVAAARQGKRVGLLSIDPAKRLAAALGIPLGHKLKPIILGPDTPLTGSLSAAMLDQKAVFDEMVRRHAPSAKTAERILENQLYRAASTKLAGPMEYMALAKLQDMVEDKNFDLVVLDTPPDSHALDFLARPNILAGFMENKVMSWLVKPFHVASRLGVERIFSVGERLMGGMAKVTGFQALRLFSEFLVLIQQVINGFHQSGEKIVATLQSRDTSFLLVTVAEGAALRSAANLNEQLASLGYACDALLFNKALPSHLGASLRHCRTEATGGGDRALRQLYERMHTEEQLTTAFLAEITRAHRPVPLALCIPETEELHHGAGIYRFSSFFTSAGRTWAEALVDL